VWSIFLFQAEDGIRDRNVTGVQTCALPISIIFSVVRNIFNSVVVIPDSIPPMTPSLKAIKKELNFSCTRFWQTRNADVISDRHLPALNEFRCCLIICGIRSLSSNQIRSEERRVGKEC